MLRRVGEHVVYMLGRSLERVIVMDAGIRTCD